MAIMEFISYILLCVHNECVVAVPAAIFNSLSSSQRRGKDRVCIVRLDNDRFHRVTVSFCYLKLRHGAGEQGEKRATSANTS